MSIVASMDEFEAAWVLLEPSLDPKFTVAKTEHPKEEILARIANGSVYVWATEHAAFLIEPVHVNPEYPFLNLWAVGGKLKHIIAATLEIEEMARSQGYKKLVFTGRKQWAASGAKIGFSVESITYSKDI